MTGRIGAIAVLAAACALLALAATPAHGAGSTTFTDPTGDNPGGLAADITTTTVSNDNSNVIHLQITTPNRQSQLTSDAFGVYIDADNNPATGENGTDYWISANGGDAAINLQKWNGSGFSPATAASFTGTWSGGLNASFKTDDLGMGQTFRFWIYSGSHGGSFDYAPDQASGAPYTYTLQADKTPKDTDGDKIPDPQDKCPTVPAGSYDPNRNGCPGPYRKLAGTISVQYIDYGATVAIAKPLVVTGNPLPPGSAITIVAPGWTDHMKPNSHGIAKSGKSAGKKLGAGTTFVVEAVKPNWIGFYTKYKVKNGTDLFVAVRHLCIPVGKSPAAARPCASVDHGK